MIALSASGRTIGWTAGSGIQIAWVDAGGRPAPWPTTLDASRLGLEPAIRLLAVDDGFFVESDAARCLLADDDGTFVADVERSGRADVVAVADASDQPIGPGVAGLLYRDSHIVIPRSDGGASGPLVNGSVFAFARAAIEDSWTDLIGLDHARYGRDDVVLLRWPTTAMVLPEGDERPIDPGVEVGLVRAATRPDRLLARL